MPTVPGSRGSTGRSSLLSVSRIRTVRAIFLMLFAESGACAGSVVDSAADNVGHLPMGSVSLQAQRVRRVVEAFASLPGRYLGAEPGFDAVFQVRLGDVGRTWEVRARGEHCEVRPSPVREPDVVVGTDAATWLALREGRLS